MPRGVVDIEGLHSPAAEEWCEEATLEAAIAHAPPGQDTTLHGK